MDSASPVNCSSRVDCDCNNVPLTKPFQSPLQMRQKRGQNRRTGTTRKSDIAHFSNMCIYNDTALAALAPDPKFIQAGRRPCLGYRNPARSARPVSRAARTSGTYSYMLIACSDRSIESSILFLHCNQMGIIPLSTFPYSQSLRLKWSSVEIFNSYSNRGKREPACCRPLAGMPAEGAEDEETHPRPRRPD